MIDEKDMEKMDIVQFLDKINDYKLVDNVIVTGKLDFNDISFLKPKYVFSKYDTRRTGVFIDYPGTADNSITIIDRLLQNVVFEVKVDYLQFKNCDMSNFHIQDSTFIKLEILNCDLSMSTIHDCVSYSIYFDKCDMDDVTVRHCLLNYYILYNNSIVTLYNDGLAITSRLRIDSNTLIKRDEGKKPYLHFEECRIDVLDATTYLLCENEVENKPTLPKFRNCTISHAVDGSRDQDSLYCKLINGYKVEEELIGYKIIKFENRDWKENNENANRQYVMATLKIPKGAIVYSNNLFKCRTNKAEVLDIEKYTDCNDFVFCSSYDSKTEYKLGKKFNIKNFSYNSTLECAEGIHFFLNKEDALEYKKFLR